MSCGQQVLDLDSTVSQAMDALTNLDGDTLEKIALTRGNWNCEQDARTSPDANQTLGSVRLRAFARLLDLSGTNMRLLRRMNRKNSVHPEYVSGSGSWGTGDPD